MSSQPRSHSPLLVVASVSALRRSVFTLLSLLLAAMLTACAGTEAPGASTPVAATPSPAAAVGSAQVTATPVPSGQEMPTDPASRDGMYAAPPDMAINPAKYYYATFKTARGDIKVQLFADRAPVTVNNFVFLARAGYYDGTIFHRVLDGFMAQGGDPTGTGAGGPGYEFQDEIFPGLNFDRPGLLAMANRGPTTNGSQFFITFAPTEWLNNLHTIFGEVIEGFDVLENLTRRDPSSDPTFSGDQIASIMIEESDVSVMPTPSPPPPTATPTATPTPFAPSDLSASLDGSQRPLAELSAEERIGYFNQPPAMVIDTDLTYTAVISTTKGAMVMELFMAQAPIAVNNFVVLANLGLFDGVPINQAVPAETLIFGALDNTPTGDAGYLLAAETSTEIELARGLVSYIPVQQLEDSTTSSSTILLVALGEIPPEVLGLYSWFGQIVEGLDVLDSLTIEDQVLQITIVHEG